MGAPVIVCLCITALMLSVQLSDAWYFDNYVYATQWPASFCFDDSASKKFGSDHCDRNKNITTWTIHGLWPSVNETYPNYCNGTSCTLSDDDIGPLEDQMRAVWPSFGGVGDGLEFWKHEWCKHGTCAANITFLNSPVKFFKYVIGLHADLSLLKNLSKNLGILPRTNLCYSYEQVVGGINKYFKESVIVSCTYDKESKRQHLGQIEICFDKQFQKTCNPTVMANRKPTNYLGSASYGMPRLDPCRSTEQICYFPIKHDNTYKNNEK